MKKQKIMIIIQFVLTAFLWIFSFYMLFKGVRYPTIKGPLEIIIWICVCLVLPASVLIMSVHANKRKKERMFIVSFILAVILVIPLLLAAMVLNVAVISHTTDLENYLVFDDEAINDAESFFPQKSTLDPNNSKYEYTYTYLIPFPGMLEVKLTAGFIDINMFESEKTRLQSSSWEDEVIEDSYPKVVLKKFNGKAAYLVNDENKTITYIYCDPDHIIDEYYSICQSENN